MNQEKRICFNCDKGKGHTMVPIYSYKVSGDVDKLLSYICPKCNYRIAVKSRSKEK